MANFFFRNPVYCIKNPRTAWATRKAMQAYRKAHQYCEFTGRTPVHVHHIEPIQFAPGRAADMTNMISLHPKVHFVLGHACDWKQYVRDVDKIAARAEVVAQTPNETGQGG